MYIGLLCSTYGVPIGINNNNNKLKLLTFGVRHGSTICRKG